MNELMLTAMTAGFASLVLVRVVMAAAGPIGAIVDPSNDRWGDRRVPKIGGLGIAGAIAIGCAIAPGVDLTRLAVVVAVLAASGLGLADDLGSVSPRRRVTVQAVIGLALGAVVGRDLGAGAAVMAALGLIGVVALANFTNLVDNADGLAASLSTVSALTIAGVGRAAGSADDSLIIAVAIAGSAIGFLVWNRPAARVFMGDCGSLMLGTALAGAGLLVLRDSASTGSTTSLVVLALPIAVVMQAGDVALVIVSRVRRGASPMRGGVDHTSHRLLRAGLGPWRMLAAIVTPAALAGVGIIAAVQTRDARVVGFAAAVFVGLVFVGEAMLAKVVPYPYPPQAASTPPSDMNTDPMEATDPGADPIKTAGGHVSGHL